MDVKNHPDFAGLAYIAFSLGVGAEKCDSGRLEYLRTIAEGEATTFDPGRLMVMFPGRAEQIAKAAADEMNDCRRVAAAILKYIRDSKTDTGHAYPDKPHERAEDGDKG